MTTSTLLRAAFTMALAFALSGCIFFETSGERAMRNDPNFKAGYADGCASASARGTSFRGDKVRDEALFESSKPYRAGWGNGFGVCNNELNRNANPNVSGMPDQRPNP